jgi:L-rhamnose mutarotase
MPVKRIASVMKLLPGFEAEYQYRHETIWPELVTLLKQAGICEYSIFLDPDSLNLFAFLKAEEEALLETLPAKAIMKKWWMYMSDIMETNEDQSPVSRPLQEVFYLP